MKNLLFILILIVINNSCTASNDVRLYVSPDGNDADVGTVKKPLQTLEGARQAVRKVRMSHPGEKVTVYFKGGEYPLEQPVKFTAEDSGSKRAPVVYQAMEGEIPVFTGGKKLTKWTKPKDAPELERLASTVRDQVYVTDLATAGITNFGDPTDIGQRPELFCNGHIQTLARWPANGFVQAGSVKGDTTFQKHGLLGYDAVRRNVSFGYSDAYQDRWAQEEDIRLCGYWYWDWQDGYQKVTQWDATTRTVRLGEPYHQYGYRDGFRYFGLNLFCEIDQPGKWYLSRSTGRLSWYPPDGIDPEKAEVSLTCFSEPYMLEMNDCSYITFEGLTFREGRGSAVKIEGGTHNLLSGCRIERFGQDGIHINGGTNHGAAGCYLSDFGHGGFRITGGDRKTLTPCGHFVEHTVVKNFSNFQRCYAPAVFLNGCGIRIANNRFCNSPSSALEIYGNELQIEYNEISKVVTESDDQGALDISYDPSYRGVVIRYNRWSDICGDTTYSEAAISGTAAVRFDDLTCGMLVYGNLFERCGSLLFGGVQIHGGKDNRIENNVFYECSFAVSFTPWGEERWLQVLDGEMVQKAIYGEVDINSEVYRKKYPELRSLRLNADVNSVTDNLMISCKQIFRDQTVIQTRNNTELEADGKPIEAFCTKSVLAKYGLQPIPVEKIGPKKNRWLCLP